MVKYTICLQPVQIERGTREKAEKRGKGRMRTKKRTKE
jgi:hypothetical protein